MERRMRDLANDPRYAMSADDAEKLLRGIVSFLAILVCAVLIFACAIMQ